MALRFIEAVDLAAYSNGIRDTQVLGFTFELAGQPSQGIGSIEGFIRFSDERDRIYCAGGKTGAVNDALAYIDPLLVSQSFPNALAIEELSDNVFVGQLNPSTGLQPHYHRRTAASELRSLNAQTLAVGGAVFPTPDEPGGLTFDAATGVTAGNPGHWSMLSHRDMVIFQGLTDGVPGETVATGPNVYPEGLALMVTDSGTVSSANDADNACIWIDLDVGRAVGIAPWPGRVTSSLVANSEGPIANDEFRWVVKQYIPDDDATLALPKGEILMIPNAGSDIEDASASTAHVYARFIDFNPFGVVASAGSPPRVHGRITLTTRLNFVYNPVFNVGGGPNAEGQDYDIVFHPPTRRFLMIARIVDASVTGAANRVYMGSFSRAVDPVIVTNPAPRSVPRTNDIVPFETFVGGDISEPVSGQDVQFTLERVSTEGEVLTGAFTPASTSTVANPPIDANAAGDPEGTLVVYADGTPLVETTDYTVVLATGVITWVTDQSGATLVTCDYEHRQTPATPAHGTLITQQVITDENGIAATRVQYADDDTIVGEIDKLTSAAV